MNEYNTLKKSNDWISEDDTDILIQIISNFVYIWHQKAIIRHIMPSEMKPKYFFQIIS